MSVRLRRDGEIIPGTESGFRTNVPVARANAMILWRAGNDSWLFQHGRDRWDMTRWRWDEFTRPDDGVLEMHLMGWHPGWDEAAGTGYVIEVDP
jgi:hypothetical protein